MTLGSTVTYCHSPRRGDSAVVGAVTKSSSYSYCFAAFAFLKQIDEAGIEARTFSELIHLHAYPDQSLNCGPLVLVMGAVGSLWAPARELR